MIRGDTLGGVNLILEITTPMEGVIRVKTYHYEGELDDAPKFDLNLSDGACAAIDAQEDADTVRVVSGKTQLVVEKKDWKMTYYSDGKKVTSSSYGYLLKRPDGSVWQWDMWQPGMAIMDFTNPAACKWFQDKLAAA